MQPKLIAAPNFRDFGGLPTSDGRRIRYGWLYRSEALDTLTVADLETLHPLAVRTICDLRTSRERRERPNRLPPGWAADVLTVAENIDAGAADMVNVMRQVMHTDAGRVAEYMRKTYGAFPEQFAPMLKDLFVRLAEGRAPVLIHCAAGKDRTGFVCAMVHHALGVLPEAILEDYLLSDEHFGAPRLAIIVEQHTGAAPHAEVIDLLRVRVEYFKLLMDQIEAQYGLVDHYLMQRAGLTATLRKSLRDRLIEDKGL